MPCSMPSASTRRASCTTCSCGARPRADRGGARRYGDLFEGRPERHALRDAVQRPPLRRSARAQRLSSHRVPRARHSHRDARTDLEHRQDPDTKPTRRAARLERAVGHRAAAIQASSPIMALVLTLVAVPLSRLRPRQGRYARVGFAIVVYFVYSNLLSACQGLDREGELPPRSASGGCTFWPWRSVCTWCIARDEKHVNTLDRYLYRTVLLYTADGDGGAVDARRPVPVHQPAKRHRRRRLRRRRCVPLHAAQPAAAGFELCPSAR
jgi:hypothetical protein